jgi:hypothetical protein
MHADHRAKLFEYEKYIPLGRMQLAEASAPAGLGQKQVITGGKILTEGS